MDRPTCKTCMFFRPEVMVNCTVSKDDMVYGGTRLPGECHRHAPRSDRHFPLVVEYDWCGEHDQWWRYNNWLIDNQLRDKQEASPCPTSGSSEDRGTTESSSSTSVPKS